MGNPNVHDHTNLPILVAGGAAGKMKGGRHIRYDEPTPLANLHLTLLDKVGVRLDSFADSTGQSDRSCSSRSRSLDEILSDLRLFVRCCWCRARLYADADGTTPLAPAPPYDGRRSTGARRKLHCVRPAPTSRPRTATA